jgi:hypothetical protein
MLFQVHLSLATELYIHSSGADNTTMSIQYHGEYNTPSRIRIQLSLATALPFKSSVEDISTFSLRYRGEHIRSGRLDSNAALTGNYTFYSIERR